MLNGVCIPETAYGETQTGFPQPLYSQYRTHVTMKRLANAFYIQPPRLHDNRVTAPYPIGVSLPIINRPEVHEWRTDSVLWLLWGAYSRRMDSGLVLGIAVANIPHCELTQASWEGVCCVFEVEFESSSGVPDINVHLRGRRAPHNDDGAQTLLLAVLSF